MTIKRAGAQATQTKGPQREAKDGKYRKALETFTSGLVHLDNYEELLNTWEESNPSAPQDEDADKENEEQPKKKNRNSADVCCGPDAEKTSGKPWLNWSRLVKLRAPA